MYNLLKALNKELDSGIENTFSNEMLKKELDGLYFKIKQYKTKENAIKIDELLKKLDKAMDNADKNEEQINASDDFFEKIVDDKTGQDELLQKDISMLDDGMVGDLGFNTFKNANKVDKSTSNEEKEEILKDLDYDVFDNNISFRQFLQGVIILFVVVSFLGSFVAIREKIYYNSRVYGELMSKKEVLLEEQKELKRKIESLQFQNNIMNYFDN